MNRGILTLVAALSALGSCKCGDADKKDEGQKSAAQPVLATVDGLAMRLSEGEAQGQARAQSKVATATTLSESETTALLARLPPLASEAGDRAAFNLRAASKPAPRPGTTMDGVFPADETAPRPNIGPAAAPKVVRYSPEGDVPLAPHLSVTFSEPMVAVTGHHDTAQVVPVTISPQPKGTWRWVGTKTLLFDPDHRFPQATNYKVKVAAGTKSSAGVPLAAALEWSFQTPPLTVESAHPFDGPTETSPTIAIRFDQKFKTSELLPHVVLDYGGKRHPIRVATDAEIEADPVAAELKKAAKSGEYLDRVLFARPVNAVPVATTVALTVRQGAPSAEGPRLTQGDQSSSFTTYGPLQVTLSHCDREPECPPQSGWSIEMTNDLEAEIFDPDSFEIKPALRGQTISMNGRYLRIRGLPVGNTTYEVTLPAELTDIYGQKLGKREARTFHVGPALPALSGPSGLVIADPHANKPTIDVYSINVPELSVEIRKVSPQDWHAFAAFQYRWRDLTPPPLPGRSVFSGIVKPVVKDSELVETAIDLSAALSDGLGHALVVIKPTSWPTQYEPRVHAWVQFTKLGLDTAVDSAALYANVTELASGKPASGVELTITPDGISGKTGADGTAVMKANDGAATGHRLLIAKRGGDVVFLPRDHGYWGEGQPWFLPSQPKTLRWLVFDDRSMYRPGEEVSVKGWVREVDNGVGGDLARPSGLAQVGYRIRGPRGNELGKGTLEVNASGGFDLRFALPATPNLGTAFIDFLAASPLGGQTRHPFQIQEFRRPEYEVTTVASPGPHTIGSRATVTANATYYSGGGLTAAPVNWSVVASPTNFAPPGHEKFTFGEWVPWWISGYSKTPVTAESFEGTTGSSGEHVLAIEFLSAKPARPMSVVATARVTDVNRQAWASAATLLVHPSSLYVGIRRDKVFSAEGEPINFDLVVADQEGKVTQGTPIDARVVRLERKWKAGQFSEVELDEKTCERTSGSEPVSCSVPAGAGGVYRITATIVDKEGRSNQSSMRTWVSGGKRLPARNVELEQVELIPNSKEYKVGDTAEILVRAPFENAEAIFTIRRSGIVSSERITFTGSTHILRVPIREGDTPNLHVQVEAVGQAPRLGADGNPNPALPPRPAFASGTINLPIPPLTRTLAVSAEPSLAKVEPGGSAQVSVTVADASGAAVAGAEVAVIVVDESVLALSRKTTPDPIAGFYGQRGAGAYDRRLRAYVKLANPERGLDIGGEPPAPPSRAPGAMPRPESEADNDRLDEGALGGALGRGNTQELAAAVTSTTMRSKDRKQNKASPQTPIAVRVNFNALASFAPAEKSDAAGRVSVPIKVPDNLTRYRIMVVAVHEDRQFGSAESSITARMPLMVRPSPPRFLNFGDEFELPIVVQNQTDADLDVNVAVRSVNAMITAGGGRRLVVPANDRLEVRFPSKALLPGVARFQVGVSAGKWADASTFELPVWTPATTEAFATYGSIGDETAGGAIAQRIERPSDVVTEFGGLELSTSSTQLQALTDAVIYLYRYPFECAEQLSSRILGLAALRDVLAAFEADGLPAPAALTQSVEKDIERLRNIQNPSGGFGFWNYRDDPWPYLSVHVTHALARAKQKGYPVPQEMLARAQAYVAAVESHIPSTYPEAARHSIIAYSLYVRKLLGDVDTAKARSLLTTAGIDKLAIEALAWVLYTIAKEGSMAGEVDRIIRQLDNRATETAGTATFATSMADGAHLILHSDRRADALVLEALLEAKPRHDLVEKVVRGLLAHRKAGAWLNTQENVFVLLAMDRYFAEYEKTTPNFVARAWLGDRYAGDHAFKGRTSERHRIDVPMAELAAGGEELILQRDGAGRLYYRIGMRYAPTDLTLPPADHGFAVERTYEAVDDPGDVRRDADGTWIFKAGTRVRVRVTMVAESRRYHVALIDPLPAGLEPLNPALKVTGQLPADPAAAPVGPYWWWQRSWYEHQNMRDERVEAFASLLWAGVHEYSYLAAATTPGSFVAPPAKAEEMYAPETFGRSAGDRVRVE